MKRWVHSELIRKTINVLFVWIIIVVKLAWQGLIAVGEGGGGGRKTEIL